jgi:histidyl-tRNA synthetase
MEYRVTSLQSSLKRHDENQIRRVATAIHDYMALYGYSLIETPLVEDADLFLTKAGDQVAERLFTFERFGRTLALRPEFTASAAYKYLQRGKHDVVRWQYSGSIFDDNPHRRDDNFQKYSIGAELIGMDGPAAEAEIISLATHGLTKQGVTAWQLIIGHVGLTQHLLSQFELDARTQRFILNRRSLLNEGLHGKAMLLEELGRYLPETSNSAEGIASDNENPLGTQKMLDVLLDTSRRGSTMGGRDSDDITKRLMQKRKQMDQHSQIVAAVDFLDDWVNIQHTPESALKQIEHFVGYDSIARKMYDNLENLLDLLQAYKIPLSKVVLKPDLARTWDYYTGVVFEIYSENNVQIAGGGRYDELTRLVGGYDDTPAVGFAYYIDPLLDTLPGENPNLEIGFVLVNDDNSRLIVATWAHTLREHGFPVTVTNAIPTNTKRTLVVDEYGQLIVRQQSYSPEQIELLILTLNGILESDD